MKGRYIPEQKDYIPQGMVHRACNHSEYILYITATNTKARHSSSISGVCTEWVLRRSKLLLLQWMKRRVWEARQQTEQEKIIHFERLGSRAEPQCLRREKLLSLGSVHQEDAAEIRHHSRLGLILTYQHHCCWVYQPP